MTNKIIKMEKIFYGKDRNLEGVEVDIFTGEEVEIYLDNLEENGVDFKKYGISREDIVMIVDFAHIGSNEIITGTVNAVFLDNNSQTLLVIHYGYGIQSIGPFITQTKRY